MGKIRPEERLMGTEVEHGVNKNIGSHSAAILKATGVYYNSPATKIQLSPTQHQMHVMNGPTIEVGTPECRGPIETGLQEMVGMRRLQAATAIVNAEKPGSNPICFYRNNRSELYGHSWGHHASFQMDYNAFEWLKELIPTLKAAWWGLIGNGWMASFRAGQECFRFAFSQRAGVMVKKADGDTQTTRALVNTRDESLVFGEQGHTSRTVRRYHDISGNTVMSDTQLVLMLGMMDLAIAMIEDNEFLRDNNLSFEARDDNDKNGPLDASHRWSADLWASERIPMRITEPNGEGQRTGIEAMTWLEVMGWWRNAACDFLLARPERSTPARLETLAWWKFFLDAYARRDYVLLARYLDCWTVYREIYLPMLKRHGADPRAPRIAHAARTAGKEMRLIDLIALAIREFASINPDRGLYWMLLKKGKVARYFRESELSAAERTPPEGRPAVREDFCQRILRDFPGWNPRIKEWMEMGAADKNWKDVEPFVPLDSTGPCHPEQIEKFFARLKSLENQTGRKQQ